MKFMSPGKGIIYYKTIMNTGLTKLLILINLLSQAFPLLVSNSPSNMSNCNTPTHSCTLHIPSSSLCDTSNEISGTMQYTLRHLFPVSIHKYSIADTPPPLSLSEIILNLIHLK